MAFLSFDLPAHADDTTAAASVMFRLTAQLLQPAADTGKRQPRRALQRVAPSTAAPRQPHTTGTTAASTAAPITPPDTPDAIVWAGLTARPRDTGRVSLEAVWWTAQAPHL